MLAHVGAGRGALLGGGGGHHRAVVGRQAARLGIAVGGRTLYFGWALNRALIQCRVQRRHGSLSLVTAPHGRARVKRNGLGEGSWRREQGGCKQKIFHKDWDGRE